MRLRPSPSTRPVGGAMAVMLVCFGAGIALRQVLGEGYDSLIFVLGVTMVGALAGTVPAAISAFLAAIVFNLFVATPLYVPRFTHFSDQVPLLAYLISALISGGLSGRLRNQAFRARQANAGLRLLLTTSQSLSDAQDVDVVVRVLEQAIAKPAGSRLGLYRLENGQVLPLGRSPNTTVWLDMARQMAENAPLPTGRWQGVVLHTCPDTRIVMVLEDWPGVAEGLFLTTLSELVIWTLERMQMSAELAEARAQARTDELRSALLSSVSHDLRSPLTAISTSAASLLAYGETMSAQTTRELLANIVTQSERLNHVTTNLLQMSRMQAGDGPLTPSVLVACDVVRKVIARHAAMPDAPPLRFQPPRAEMLVWADAVLFDLAVDNVLDNAIRYAPPGQPITLSLAACDGFCEIAITDEGPGIPAREQNRVFERFYRGSGARGVSGSGLGLAIARGFVEASGGDIAIQSPVSDGHGTRVVIRLPLIEPVAMGGR